MRVSLFRFQENRPNTRYSKTVEWFSECSRAKRDPTHQSDPPAIRENATQTARIPDNKSAYSKSRGLVSKSRSSIIATLKYFLNFAKIRLHLVLNHQAKYRCRKLEEPLYFKLGSICNFRPTFSWFKRITCLHLDRP